MSNEEIQKNLLKSISKVECDVSLSKFNPLKIGGVADYYTVAATTIDLAAAVKAAVDNDVPYIVFGTAERLLFSDGGFPGLVIHNLSSTVNFDRTRSQVVVDSGVRLQSLVTQAAALGLGGLTSFYDEAGTVGGASYANSAVDQFRFISLVRSVTVISPPTKLRPEAAIVRYRGEWLKKNDQITKLQEIRKKHDFTHPQPIILTQVLQLTSMRPEEIRGQVGLRARTYQNSRPKEVCWGPVFHTSAQYDLTEVLTSAKVAQLKVGGMYAHRYFPNFICSSAKHNRASEAWELVKEIKEQVRQVHGIVLEPRFELTGVW